MNIQLYALLKHPQIQEVIGIDFDPHITSRKFQQLLNLFHHAYFYFCSFV